jgi:hypothetical protein
MVETELFAQTRKSCGRARRGMLSFFANDGINPQRIIFIMGWKFSKTITGACWHGAML